MKRILAVLLCCCLLLSVPVAMAAPAEDAPSAENPDGQTPETAPAEGEAPATENADPENTDPEAADPEAADPEATPEEGAPAGPDLSSLASETAIHKMDVTVTVDEGGRATVTQLVEMVVVGTVEKLRFSFPEGAKKCDVAGHWTGSEKENGVKYLTVSNRKGFTGTQTFTLSYTMSGLVKGGEASQVLTLPLLSLQDYRIGALTFTVSLPKDFETTPRFSSGYYSNLVEDLLSINTQGSAIAGRVNEIMRDNDTLTMSLTLPEGYFAGRFGESKVGPVMTVLVFLLLALTVLYWFRTLRNPPLRVQARTLPPDGVNPGDVPFLLAGGDADFNMLVSHWAVLGYLSIYVGKSGNVLLERRMAMGNERRAFERKLFGLLFGREDTVDGASIRYKKVGEKAMQVIPRYWARRLYDKRSGSPLLVKLLCALACALSCVAAMDVAAPQKLHGLFLFVSFIAGFAMCWLVFRACGAYYLNDWLWTGVGAACGLLLLIVGGVGGATVTMLPSVALSALMGWQTAHGGLRRPYGDEVIGQTLGFRRFLHNASERHVLQMLHRDPQYFYKILPYAEAMGQGKQFVTLFHDCKLEPCQWYESARGIPNTASAFYDRYVDTLDLLNLSIRK